MELIENPTLVVEPFGNYRWVPLALRSRPGCWHRLGEAAEGRRLREKLEPALTLAKLEPAGTWNGRPLYALLESAQKRTLALFADNGQLGFAISAADGGLLVQGTLDASGRAQWLEALRLRDRYAYEGAAPPFFQLHEPELELDPVPAADFGSDYVSVRIFDRESQLTLGHCAAAWFKERLLPMLRLENIPDLQRGDVPGTQTRLSITSEQYRTLYLEADGETLRFQLQDKDIRWLAGGELAAAGRKRWRLMLAG